MNGRTGCYLALAFVVLILTGCGDGERELPVLEIISAPVIIPSANVPLAFTLEVEGSLNTSATVRLDNNQGHAFSITFRNRSSNHSLDIVGLRANSTYSVEVSLETTDLISLTADGNLQFSTDPLPADFPDITLLQADTALMEPGVTLMDTWRKDESAAYLVIVDNEGEVIWYLPSAVGSATHRSLSNLFLNIDPGSGLIREFDIMGEVATSFHSGQSHAAIGTSTPVDVAEFHDDVFLQAALGPYFSIVSDETTTVSNYPLDENDAGQTGDAIVRDEPVVEFNAAGTVLNTYNFLDILKPTRIGYDGTEGLPAAANWADVNSIARDSADGGIIASLRNQDAVVKFAADGGTLLWILGPSANWEGFEDFLLTPSGTPFRWQYHQHSAKLTPDRTILMFDNGNRQASPFTGEPIVGPESNSSRAVEYSFDEANMTVSQVWEWGFAQSGESLYAPFAGDADRLPVTGNTLITFGGLCEENGAPSDDIQACRSTGRVIEIGSEADESVFDLLIDDSDPLSSGYVVNRSERLASLYPGNLVVIALE